MRVGRYTGDQQYISTVPVYYCQPVDRSIDGAVRDLICLLSCGRRIATVVHRHWTVTVQFDQLINQSITLLHFNTRRDNLIFTVTHRMAVVHRRLAVRVFVRRPFH